MSVYEKLGVRKVINAAGTLTMLGGSLMPPEVLEAMNEAAKAFVLMDELHEKAGKVIAEITGAEAGYVTAGAAAGLVLATAACIAGKDPEKIRRLPFTEGMKNEVIIPKIHRNPYDQAFSQAGARLIEIGTSEGFSPSDLEAAITERTAAIAFIFFTSRKFCDMETLKEVVKVAKKHGIPVIVDAAAELPPLENLRDIIAAGADIVAFSGGKAIQGPNDSGFVCGRKELIEACALQGCPHHAIGRPMKIGKEQIVGLVVALQRYVSKDHTADRDRWEAVVRFFLEEFSNIPHVKVRRLFPDPSKGEYSAQCWPRAQIIIDEESLGMKVSEITNILRSGNPAIWTEARGNSIVINPHCLVDGEEKIIARRLKEIFESAIMRNRARS
ncbi:MAG: aminotransferase class V-fold PLP-dependent enzyme [Candidatus Bathyarchaeia archaeon]